MMEPTSQEAVHAPLKEVIYMQSVAMEGQPCEGLSPHSFFGIEAATIERIAEWIGATRVP